ncbi:MAG: radical SAM protein, partial [Candidatus Aenigmatarchaeota archaeon]
MNKNLAKKGSKNREKSAKTIRKKEKKVLEKSKKLAKLSKIENELEKVERILEHTQSICPECFKERKIHKINASIVEENGKIWIKKRCEKHGTFKSIVFNDSKLYYKWIKYKVDGKPIRYKSPKGEIKSIDATPSLSGKLYDLHLSQSVLTNLLVTNRCNLRCSYCFMNAGASGYVYEPSLEDLKKIMKQAREAKPVPSKAIQITGGEPTVRDDLVEIIKAARELGFRHVQLNTNGIKLAESLEYCNEIVEAGVNTIYMSFDGVTKNANPWIEENKKAIENLRAVDFHSVVLVPVVTKSNLLEMPEVVKFASRNIDVIRGINFQPLSFCGRLQNVTEDFIEKQRVDYVDLFKTLENGLDGQITIDDFYPVPFVYPVSKLVEKLKGYGQVEFTAHPTCGGATYVFVEKQRDSIKLTPITRIVDVESLMEFIKDLSKIEGSFLKLRIALAFLRNINKYVKDEGKF